MDPLFIVVFGVSCFVVGYVWRATKAPEPVDDSFMLLNRPGLPLELKEARAERRRRRRRWWRRS
jgi:hypothetical protein